MPARHDYSAVPPLGAYVANRCPVRVQLDHLGLDVEPFVPWEPPTPDTETLVFREFWDWLTDVRLRAAEAGHTVKA